MPTLSSNIVKREVASVHDVEEALSRQALYGGDLVTNLLELASVSEQRLTHVIAESAGLEPAPAGELPRASDTVRGLVPVDIAQRYGVYPLDQREGKLLIAVNEPLPPAVAHDLTTSVRLELVQQASSLARIRQALARDYGVELDQRTARVLARLAGEADPYPSVRAPAVAPTHQGDELVAASAGATAANTVASSRTSREAQAGLDMAALAGIEASAQRPGRRRGPYSAAQAESDLHDAANAEAVLTAFFDFAAQYFEYSALFAVQGDLAEGRDAHGVGAPRSSVVSIGVPLDLPSTLQSVVSAEPYRLTRLSASGLDGVLVKDLERRPGPLVLLLSVRVRGRSVLILYGDHGELDVQLAAVGDVIAFVPLVEGALERIILARKGRPPGARRRAAADGAQHKAQSVPPPRERVQTLASVVSRPSSGPPRSPVISVGPPRGSEPSAPDALTRPANTSTIQRAPESVPPLAHARSLPPTSRTPIPSSFAPGAPPHTPAEPPSMTTAAPARAPLTATLGQASAEPEPISDDQLIFESPEGDSGGVFQQSRAVSYSARPLPIPQHSQELSLPTVIVSGSEDMESLIVRLNAADPEAAEQLVTLGAAAVPSLVGAFPGTITQEPRRGGADGAQRASDCGPLLKVLARIGPKAAGVLAARTNDRNPLVRAWATRLLGEMPSMEAARAVSRRFTDGDPDVRRAALAAGRLLQTHAVSAAVLAGALSDMLMDRTRNDGLHHMVIEAIADLREARAIPGLASLLSSASADLQRSAHWALVVIARTDYAQNATAWEQWWRVNASRHRIEWLIDALMHENQELRRAAGDELKALTKEYFGYYDDLPARERERAQQRYREWWETKGKARFSTPSNATR